MDIVREGWGKATEDGREGRSVGPGEAGGETEAISKGGTSLSEGVYKWVRERDQGAQSEEDDQRSKQPWLGACNRTHLHNTSVSGDAASDPNLLPSSDSGNYTQTSSSHASSTDARPTGRLRMSDLRSRPSAPRGQVAPDARNWYGVHILHRSSSQPAGAPAVASQRTAPCRTRSHSLLGTAPSLILLSRLRSSRRLTCSS